MKKAIYIFGFALLALSFSFHKAEKKTVVIEVSHGGQDSGTEYDGITEKDLVLTIANKIKEMNTHQDLNIILTREDDEFMELDRKLEFIQSLKPNYLISLHINSSKDMDANGFELYVNEDHSEKEASSKLALTIKNALPKEVKNSQIKSGNFYMLKNVNCPATLIEMGYLSNDEDRAVLMNAESQNRIARAIYDALY